MRNAHFTAERPEPTDGLYDCSSSHLAEVFGRRTVQMMRDGRDPYQAARLAFTFGQRAIAEQAKVIGQITPDTPWGMN